MVVRAPHPGRLPWRAPPPRRPSWSASGRSPGAVDGHNGRVSAERLTGRLLVATPLIDEGVFHRSVIPCSSTAMTARKESSSTSPSLRRSTRSSPGGAITSASPRPSSRAVPSNWTRPSVWSRPRPPPCPRSRSCGPGGFVDLDAVPALVASQVESRPCLRRVCRVVAGAVGGRTSHRQLVCRGRPP